jgi:hypothetical protein
MTLAVQRTVNGLSPMVVSIVRKVSNIVPTLSKPVC